MFTQLYGDECVVHNCLTNSALLQYFKALDAGEAPYPAHMDLSKNYVGDRNMAAICTVLSTIPSLESLDLRNMDLQMHGVEAVCRLAQRHKNLRRIDLRGNPLFAGSGRLLLALVKANPCVTQCLFDDDQMPSRFASAIRTQIGRNIANAHPCTWETCEEAEARTQHLPPIDLTQSHAGSGCALNAFQSQLVDEFRGGHADSLLAIYAASGQFAVQFFADFGPDALPFLAEHAPRLFPEASRNAALSTAPRSTLVRRLLRDEVRAYRGNPLVADVCDGTLLPQQLESAAAMLDAPLDSDADVARCVEIVDHIRRALSHLRASGRMPDVDRAVSETRLQLRALIDDSRRLQVVFHAARYLHMDHPAMPADVSVGYAACQSPLRVTEEALQELVVRSGRPGYAKARRRLLSEFFQLCPRPLFLELTRHLVSRALDAASSTPGLHPGELNGLGGAREWVDVIVAAFPDSATASRLVEAFGCSLRQQRYAAETASVDAVASVVSEPEGSSET